MSHVKIFLSTVSAEFRSYRDTLRHVLDHPNVTAKVQEDFIATGTETLVKLDEYIRTCDTVVHLVGDMTGALAKAPSVVAIQQRYPDFAARFPMLKEFLEPGGPALPYTQWEAWLALYHGRKLIIATPKNDAPRDKPYQLIDDQREAQQSHLVRLKGYERYSEISFANVDNLAWELWRSLHDIIPQLQPPTAELGRLREMASTLLDVGRATWKMPSFVAPLNLEAQEEESDSEPRLVSIAALSEAVSKGTSLVLYGEGGIGKTTFLLELSGALLAEECPRIPLYIEAAYWASTNTEVLDYIASSPAARRHGLTADELVKLADSGLLTLVVNGWNEMPGAQKLGCFGRFHELTTTIPTLNIVVVTRSVMDVPILEAEERIYVRGLTWQSQLKVIRSELNEGAATELIDMLARDTSLRHAARSPLILKGMLAQAKKGEVTSSSAFDLLGAVVDAFEEDQQRRLSLEKPPLDNQHRYFLEGLAYELTLKQETVASRQEVLPVISTAAKQLVDDGQFAVPPRSSEVLDALSSHHLIHTDGQTVRFAHPRFQEYFAATQLFRACVDGSERDIAFLREAVNLPFWEDALLLVGDKLKGVANYAQARSLLVRTALGVDIGFACDLAGACELSETDDRSLYRDLITHVNMLCNSPLPEVINYGVACLIASGFPVFSDRLWPLIESDDQQIRLNTYRLNGRRISLKQLGESSETRIASWLPERRVELMHELADNPENYNFLVQAANEAREDGVRAAAIVSLAWNYPASEAILQAWLKAPVAVQLKHDVIGIVEYTLEQGGRSDEVQEQLRVLSREHPTKKLQLRLALAFPDEVGSDAIEAALARLREIVHLDDYATSLIALVMKHAPDRLKTLAREMVLSASGATDWARNVIQQESAETRTAIFEAAWDILNDENTRHIRAKAIGPLASRSQTLRSTCEWLNHRKDLRGGASEADRERGRQIGYLLANAPGDDLLSVVMELGMSVSYGEASELLELVLIRIRPDDSRSSETTQWHPSSEAVRTLIAAFENKSDDEVVPQHKVHVLLCCIASYVAPAEFGDLLLESCRLHLDAWERYNAVLEQWSKSRGGPRPSNPSLSGYLATAMGNWGFGALPGLLELLGHPHANQLIPQAVSRIVSGPWEEKKEGFFRCLGADIKEGERRRLAGRVLRQPDDTHQEITDIAARALGKKLTELVDQLREEQAAGSEKLSDKSAAYRMRGLLNAVANTPSPEIAEPAMHALVTGFIDAYSAVDALQSLIRQGVEIDDPRVVERIEAVFLEEAKEDSRNDSKRFVRSQLCMLMFFVKPASLLSKSLSYYCAEWQRFSHVNEIIRNLGETPSDESWCCLLEIGRRISESGGGGSEGLEFALAASLSSNNFTEFLSLIADGTWFTWFHRGWNFRHIAPEILRVIGDDSVMLDAVLDACGRSESPLADMFACAMLSVIPRGDVIRLRFGLAALDANRIQDSQSPVYSMLIKLFSLKVPLGGEGEYEVHPKACNDLRRHLYNRARGNGHIAEVSRRLLADVECQRREGGRPTDESRHPAAGDGDAWTNAMIVDISGAPVPRIDI